ncbi:MAG: BamA/TamA family outer membrane protein [candidate division KSB1 bacterium]|nr:BamA/TamA family outer membrane protein [candidate division KSB1 bacterium]
MNEIEGNRLVVKPIVILIIVVIALLLIFGLVLSRAVVAGSIPQFDDSQPEFSRQDRDRKVREAAERRYLKRREENDIRRETGDFTIGAGEMLEGHLVITRGKVTVLGKVTGSVLVVYGDALIDSTGEVLGDVVSVGGNIDRHPKSRVFGDLIETSAEYLHEDTQSPREKSKEDRWPHDLRRWHDKWDDDFKVKLHYHRVDGLFLGGELPRKYNRRARLDLGIFGLGGYAFAAKRWQYQAGAELYRGEAFRFVLGGEVYDLTDTQDEWIMPIDENTLAASLIREDFRDYYRREGYQFYVSQQLGWPLQLTAAYRRDLHLNLSNETNWSLFGGDKNFRDNPTVTEGKMVSYLGRIVLDTRDHETRPQKGWLISIEGESSRPQFKSDFDFDRYLLDIRRYQPVGWGKNFDLRLRAGSARGALPAQYLFDLGGISSLRGFRFKEFTGDRLVLVNAEYRLLARSSRLHDIPIVKILNLILFFDAGYAWFAEDNSRPLASFEELTSDKWKSNAGLALTNRDGSVRLNFAKRTDIGGKDIVVTFRLSRDF